MKFHFNFSVNKFNSLIIASLPITSQYRSFVSFLSLGELLLLISLIITLLINQFSLNIKKRYSKQILFVMYILISSLINILILKGNFATTIFERSFRYIFYLVYILYVVSDDHIDKVYFLRIYKKIAITAIIFIFVQVILFYGLSIKVYGVFQTFTTRFGPGSEYDISYISRYFFRPSSFFVEPSYHAGYTIPLLFINSCSRNKVMKLSCQFLIYFSLLLSTSGLGIVGGAIIIFLSSFYQNEKRNILRSFVSMILFAFIILTIFNSSNFVNESVERIFNANTGSAILRVFHGLEAYKEMPLFHKLLGVGYGNIGNYTRYILLLNNFSEYMNSYYYLLNNIGFFGIVSFLVYMYSFIKKINYKNFAYIIFLVILGGSSMTLQYANVIFFVLILIIISTYSLEESTTKKGDKYEHRNQ